MRVEVDLADLARDVSMLEEPGRQLYLGLLLHMAQNDVCSVPEDYELMARVAWMEPGEARIIWPHVQHLFQRRGDHWVLPWLERGAAGPLRRTARARRNAEKRWHAVASKPRKIKAENAIASAQKLPPDGFSRKPLKDKAENAIASEPMLQHPRTSPLRLLDQEESCIETQFNPAPPSPAAADAREAAEADADAAAKRLAMEGFNSVIAAVYGPTHARPWPGKGELDACREWIAFGVTTKFALDYLRDELERWRANGQPYPFGLLRVRKGMLEHWVRHSNPKPQPARVARAEAADTAQTRRLTDIMAQAGYTWDDVNAEGTPSWIYRLANFKLRAEWNAPGPQPGQPGCQAPPAMQRRFGFTPASPKLAAGD